MTKVVPTARIFHTLVVSLAAVFISSSAFAAGKRMLPPPRSTG
jgi:hypothetical protein